MCVCVQCWADKCSCAQVVQHAEEQPGCISKNVVDSARLHADICEKQRILECSIEEISSLKVKVDAFIKKFDKMDSILADFPKMQSRYKDMEDHIEMIPELAENFKCMAIDMRESCDRVMDGKLETIVNEIEKKIGERVRESCNDFLQQETKQAFQVGMEQFGICVDRRFCKLEGLVKGFASGSLRNQFAQQDEGLICGASLESQRDTNEGNQLFVGTPELLSQTATSKGCSDKAERQPE